MPDASERSAAGAYPDPDFSARLEGGKRLESGQQLRRHETQLRRAACGAAGHGDDRPLQFAELTVEGERSRQQGSKLGGPGFLIGGPSQ